jgi:cell fate (sporulation/competence/biofilm development) regulator YlbF (YheA/YmcA/DUF963 family)
MGNVLGQIIERGVEGIATAGMEYQRAMMSSAQLLGQIGELRETVAELRARNDKLQAQLAELALKLASR